MSAPDFCTKPDAGHHFTNEDGSPKGLSGSELAEELSVENRLKNAVGKTMRVAYRRLDGSVSEIEGVIVDYKGTDDNGEDDTSGDLVGIESHTRFVVLYRKDLGEFSYKLLGGYYTS